MSKTQNKVKEKKITKNNKSQYNQLEKKIRMVRLTEPWSNKFDLFTKE